MWSPGLILLLTLTGHGLALSHYEVKGYLFQNVLPQEGTLEKVSAIVEPKIKETDFFIKWSKYGEMDNSLHTFLAYLSSDSSLEDLIKKYDGMEQFTFLFWREIDVDEIPARPAIPTQSVCLNGGTKLPNSTCACGPFTYGSNCETVNCQRKGIPEGNRCFCPPGFYSQFCEIRGCRPPLMDNLNVEPRSFLLVLPVTPSMADVRTTLISNLNAALSELNSADPSWISTYLLDMFVQVDDTNFVSYITVATGAATLVNNLKNTTITTMKQPVQYPIMHSLVNIQQYSRQMHSNSIVFVFTDAPDKDATPVTYTIKDNTLELQASQTTMLWRNRVFIFFIKNSTNTVNYAADSYDTYRRMVTFSHGELFVINGNEVQTVINSVLTKLFRPEYVEVRSFAQGGDFLLDLVRDNKSQSVTIFVTIDQNTNTPSNVLITAVGGPNGTTPLKADSNGPMWAIFVIPTDWSSVKLTASPSAVCSVKAFVSSRTTLLWLYINDDNIDIGNSMNLAEMPMKMTLHPVNFQPFTGYYVEFTNRATNNPFTWPMQAIIRNEVDCTFVYKITNLPTCAAGAYTQKYTFTMNDGTVIRRIYPGFCSHEAINNGSQPIAAKYPTQGSGTGNTCYLINPQDMGGKLHDFRQVIFAIEMVKEMQPTINRLMSLIDDIIKTISSQDSSMRQFTLVVFDTNGWKGIASDYDPAVFITKFNQYLTSASASAPPKSAGAFSLDAIYHAVELELISPAQIHVFTMSDPKGSGYYWVLPIDVQVNIFYMNNNVIFPISQNFRIMQRQTGGRLIALGENDLQKETFTSSVNFNNLLLDAWSQDCSSGNGFETTVLVEKSVKQLEFTFIGNMSIGTIQISDGQKNGLSVIGKAYTVADSPGSLVLQYNSSQFSSGTFRITFSTIGSCSIQVRAISDINVAVGFTSDLHSDFPAHHPFNTRGQNDSTYVVVRVTGSSTVTGITIESTDFKSPWNDGQLFNATTSNVTQYDENTCAYQYRTNTVNMPLTTGTKITVTGLEDVSNLLFQRVFYYYTPSDNNVCSNGGSVNQYGECSCAEHFTGEYCQDRICAYGSTPSRGICMCSSFYYGFECENVLYNQTTVTEPPYPPSTTSTMAPTTTGPITTTSKSASNILISIALVFVGIGLF